MPLEIDAQNLKAGLLGLVVALAEIVRDVLATEALRLLRSASLRPEQVERLGLALRELDCALESVKATHGLHDVVAQVRESLDRLVEDALDLVAGSWEPQRTGQGRASPAPAALPPGMGAAGRA